MLLDDEFVVSSASGKARVADRHQTGTCFSRTFDRVLILLFLCSISFQKKWTRLKTRKSIRFPFPCLPQALAVTATRWLSTFLLTSFRKCPSQNFEHAIYWRCAYQIQGRKQCRKPRIASRPSGAPRRRSVRASRKGRMSKNYARPNGHASSTR